MNKIFPILAVETSGDLCSTAIMLDEKTYSEINILQKHIHSEKLILMIKQVLESVNLTVADLSQIAFSSGPGSFTGLRIGLSAIKGIAFGADKPLIAVPTFDSYALKVCNYLEVNSTFAIVSNVNTEELYFASYKKLDNKKVEIIENISLIKKEEFESYLDDKRFAFGNFSHEKVFKEADIPTARNIAEWAYLFGQELLTYDYDYLEPNYFKKFVAKVKK